MAAPKSTLEKAAFERDLSKEVKDANVAGPESPGSVGNKKTEDRQWHLAIFILIGLAVIFLILVGLYGLLIYNKINNSSDFKDLVQNYLSAALGIAGTVVGFYFKEIKESIKDKA